MHYKEKLVQFILFGIILLLVYKLKFYYSAYLGEIKINTIDDARIFNASQCKLFKYDNIKEAYQSIIIHHSALPVSYTAADIRSIHFKEFGYSDIAYHFLINKQGDIFRGRSLEFVGAHAGRNKVADSLALEYRKGNYQGEYKDILQLDPDWGSAGICLSGNFNRTLPTIPQLISLQKLIRILADSLEISSKEVHLHREIKNTQCPGRWGTFMIKPILWIINNQGHDSEQRVSRAQRDNK